MTQFYSDQIVSARGNPALGGLQGSAKMVRNTELKGGVQLWRFSFTQPAAAGAVINDVIDLAYLDVMSRMYGIFLLNSAWGAGATFSVGRLDPNLAANSSAARYIAAADMNGVVRTVVTNLMLLAGDQVGTDGLGDQSAGNPPTTSGEAPIIIQGTFLGANPVAGATLSGWIIYVAGNQA